LALTNFPNGISSFGIPIFGPAVGANSSQLLVGQVFFVNSVTGIDTLSGGGGFSPTTPLKSISFALTYVKANNGDYIYLMPGSTFTVSSATALAVSKAGVTIVGLGLGANLPTITLDTANTSTIAVSANNVSFYNCVFIANFLSIAACFTLTTAKWFTVQNCFFKETSGVLDFLNIVKSTGAANTVDGLTMINNNWQGLGTTSVNTFVLSANDVDTCTLQLNDINLANVTDQAVMLVVTAGVLTNLDCGGNKIYRKSTTSVNGTIVNVGGTTSTGWVYSNLVQTLGSGDVIFSGTSGLGAFQNFITDALGASGFLRPVADT
jgi:hypothetical protein